MGPGYLSVSPDGKHMLISATLLGVNQPNKCFLAEVGKDSARPVMLECFQTQSQYSLNNFMKAIWSPDSSKVAIYSIGPVFELVVADVHARKLINGKSEITLPSDKRQTAIVECGWVTNREMILTSSSANPARRA